MLSCGRNFTTATGSLQTPKWPQTYSSNVDCEWFIRLPNANKLVELSCEEDPYGIAGSHPGCTKDHITFYDGHTAQSNSHGPYCEFTRPGNIRMSSNLAKVVFHAGPSHSASRKGAKCTFRSVDAPTPPPPPTTPPPPQCGGILNTANGSFQSPNWPQTYPNNIECEWRIQLPDSSKLVEIKCDEEPFGIAGTFPACDTDYLKFYDSHTKLDTLRGTFCNFIKPDIMKMSSNLAMAVFHSGPSHSPSRRGFKCTFKSASPTPEPQCGRVLTAASGSFQSPNWPQTYPINIDCVWTIELPDPSKQVEISFESPFGIAGSLPACNIDHLFIHDDHANIEYGPFCYFTLPDVLKMSSNQARVVFHAGPAHSSSRLGFKANYRSVDPPTTSTCPLLEGNIDYTKCRLYTLHTFH